MKAEFGRKFSFVLCYSEVFRRLTFSRTSSETVRDSMRQETAQLRMWKSVYMTRVLVEERTGGQKAQQSEQGAGPQQQHI